MVRFPAYSRVAFAVLLAAALVSGNAHTAEDRYGSADTAAVCSTDSITGKQVCYPRIFNATNEFQEVRPGQDLPPGLHVQIDMSQGKKMAKLMAPEAGQELALVGNTEQAVLRPAESRSRQRVFGHKAEGFRAQLSVVSDLASESTVAGHARSGDLQRTLIEMEELVHDPRYAAELIYDGQATAALLRLGDPQGGKPAPWSPGVRQMASVVLGTAVQNNPELQARLYGAGAMNVLLTTLAHEVDARAMSKHIFALSALVRGHNDALKVFGGGEGLKSLRSLNSDQMDGDRRTRDSLEVRVVRLVEDVLNPELHPDFADSAAAVAGSFAANAEVWCRELDARLSQALVSEEPEAAQALYERPTAYAHALGLLCSQYPDNCMLSQSLQRLARDKIARLIDSEDVAASYRQALANILN